MANRVISNSVQGVKHILVVDHDGPASYNNTGVFTTSGETINASDFGYGGFEFVDEISLSSDQLNTVLIVLPGQSTTGNFGDARPTAVIHWFVQVGGAEVGNGIPLSGKSIRLRLTCV
jgi:hypothetical protein